jgi:uncharacterized membrane protein YfcA
MLPWFAWVALFLLIWAVLIITQGWWDRVADHWPIAIAMAVGSYVAGSTPMGGGTVGFPVLVLLFDQPAEFGRQFSFLIQAIGMTSAAIYLICSRRSMAVRVMIWAGVSSAVALTLTHYLLYPHIAGTAVKLTFACIWGGFGLVTLVKLREMLMHHHKPTLSPRSDAVLGIGAGLVGGVASGMTGVGIDMVIYTGLVLIYRSDLRPAIATSVVLMAWNSVVGTSLCLIDGTVEPEVFSNWLAASPIVLFGAPIGAFMVARIPRGPTLVFVSILCVLQLIWTISRIGPTTKLLLIVTAAVAGMNILFHLMHAFGRRFRPDPGEEGMSLLKP